MAKEVADGIRKGARQDGEISESASVRDCEKEHLSGIGIVTESFYADLRGFERSI